MSAKPEFPPRPYVPPTACGALAALGIAAILLDAAWRAYAEGAALPLPLAFGVALAGAVGLAASFAGRVRHRALCWACAGLVLGALSCLLWMRAQDAARAALDGGTASAYTFVVAGDPSSNARGFAASAVAYDAGGKAVATVRLNLSEQVEVGDELHVVGSIEELDDGDWGRSRFMRGEVASVDVAKVVACEACARCGSIQRVRRALLDAIDPAASDAQALVAGIVCGRTTELNRADASDDFAKTGLSHLVAVSGSHLALIAALLQGALRRLGLRQVGRSVLLGGVMAIYVVFTGGAASPARSLVMVGASMACAAGGRRGHALSGLALAAMALACADPGVVYDLGFQLSAASVLFIGLFFRYVAYLLERLRLPRALAEPLSLTFVAQWATLPLTVPVFGQLSLIAPLANLIAGPLMSALLVAGLIAVPLAALLPFFPWIMAVPVGLARVSIWTASVLGGVPYGSLAVDADLMRMLPLYLAAAVVFLLWWDWRAKTMAAALCAVTLAAGAWVVHWRFFAPAAVTVLDVGQADAILIREGGAAVLVDAGVDERTALALARQHVFHLDAVLITHWDSDHWGGLPDVLDALPVSAVYAANGAAAGAPAEVRDAWARDIGELSCGDELRVDGFDCRVVWPREPVAGDENGDSLCLDVEYQEGTRSLSALLTGDTELDEEGEYADEVGDIDVLKVGHHGSKVSVDAELLDTLRPEVAIASAGEGNRYGHPSEECVSAVEEAGGLFLCTKDVGDVTVYPDEEHVRVACG